MNQDRNDDSLKATTSEIITEESPKEWLKENPEPRTRIEQQIGYLPDDAELEEIVRQVFQQLGWRK